MKSGLVLPALAGLALVAAGVTAGFAQSSKPAANASFFITSKGGGKGADFGGLEGADKLCADLAKAAGLKKTTWRAYLSTRPTKQGDKDVAGVNARERIGKGPWYNVKGELVARNVADLHSDKNRLSPKIALTEKGEPNPGRAESQAKTAANQHDILTGSDSAGMYSTASGDTTCGNWTKSGEGSAIVGHADRSGLTSFWDAKSWNSAHGSRGCSPDNLKSSGGAGQLYCFAP